MTSALMRSVLILENGYWISWALQTMCAVSYTHLAQLHRRQRKFRGAAQGQSRPACQGFQAGEMCIRDRGTPTGSLSILYLVLSIFGLDIVAWALMQNEVNHYTPGTGDAF